MYFSTMWSYLSGFAAVVYIAAPIIYLCFGVLPVDAFSADFFARLIPFLVVTQILFFVAARGRKTWRGQQYSLALFPVWIKACTTAAANVMFGRDWLCRHTENPAERRPTLVADPAPARGHRRLGRGRHTRIDPDVHRSRSARRYPRQRDLGDL